MVLSMSITKHVPVYQTIYCTRCDAPVGYLPIEYLQQPIVCHLCLRDELRFVRTFNISGYESNIQLIYDHAFDSNDAQKSNAFIQTLEHKLRREEMSQNLFRALHPCIQKP